MSDGYGGNPGGFGGPFDPPGGNQNGNQNGNQGGYPGAPPGQQPGMPPGYQAGPPPTSSDNKILKYMLIGFGCLVAGFVGIILLGIIAAIAIPSIVKYKEQSKAESGDPRVHLRMIGVSQMTYYVEQNAYAARFADLDWQPADKSKYSYYLPEDSVESDDGPFVLPDDIQPAADATSFTVYAASNLDNDPALDIWSINDAMVIEHVQDDNQYF